MLGLYRQWTQLDPVTTCYGSNGVVTILTNDRDTRRMPVPLTLDLFDSFLVRLQSSVSRSCSCLPYTSSLAGYVVGSLFKCRSSNLVSQSLSSYHPLPHCGYALLPHHACLRHIEFVYSPTASSSVLLVAHLILIGILALS